MAVDILEVQVPVPPECNVIVGQSHFIKTAEDIFEELAESGTAVRFGVAFCEASGKRLVRSEGNDGELTKLAEQAALEVACGHSFVVYLKGGYPVNVLNRIKGISEVCSVFAATANPLAVIVAENARGRGILGVIDGQAPLGVETPADRAERTELLRRIGYKR